MDYYRGMIALRMQLPGVLDKSYTAERRILWAREVDRDCVEVCLDNMGEQSRWSQLLMVFNGSGLAREICLPEGSWQLLADGESSFRWAEDVTVSQKAEVKAVSVLILGMRGMQE